MKENNYDEERFFGQYSQMSYDIWLHPLPKNEHAGFPLENNDPPANAQVSLPNRKSNLDCHKQ